MPYTILPFPILDSTSEEAKRRALAGEKADTVIWARQQEMGRGRYGRQWASPEGNLYMSLLLRPSIPLQKTAGLSFVAALAVGEMLAEFAPIAYKWPNDILMEGRKIAGILLESSAKAGSPYPEWLILGIGVNIASSPENTAFPAISLQQAGKLPENPDPVNECLQNLLGSFTKWRKLWESEGFPAIREAWLAKAWRRGEVITANTGNARFEGVFADMSESGALVLRLADGSVKEITAGEVYF